MRRRRGRAERPPAPEAASPPPPSSGPGGDTPDAAATSERVEPVRVPLPLPQPPLVHGALGFSLRPWGSTSNDGSALAAAWADPDVLRWTEVPDVRDLAAAERWIAAEERRRTSGSAVDLVISELGAPEHVWGEVGLAVVAPERGWAEVGFWLVPSARGMGRAAAAVGLVVDWALRELPLVRLFARTHPDNPAAAAVVERAGFTLAGQADDGSQVWRSP